jgi:curved DNA-binding protein CbpA
MTDPYAVLALSHRATNEEIKTAYWALAKRLHPDINAGDAQVESRIREINSAYETLGDPELRAAYDLELAHERRQARRAFWTSAATGAATFVLTVSCVSMLVMWRPNPPIDSIQKRQFVVTATAPLSQPMIGAPLAEGPLAVASLQAVAQRDIVAYAAAPQEGNYQTWAMAAEKDVGRASADRNADRKFARGGPVHNGGARQINAAKPTRSMRGNSPALQKPRPPARSVAALRWPSADEPFIGLGGRH